ncbi:hypothetical protein EDD86DRAFT_212320 [Gorgonomyces haynaldii]|nr:hypothetical protein EDD86DRAFT_212320 [Gorgonomyces haynaldii]
MPFFEKLEIQTDPNDFETKLVDDADLLPLQECSSFVSEKQLIQQERVLQCLHIIRNLSIMNENTMAFIRDAKILIIIAKAMALPSYSFYIEIKQHALDIYENMSRLMVLQGSNDFYLACLQKMICDSDRSLMLVALKSLCNLAQNELNHRTILNIETPLLQRLLQLLLVQDEALNNATLEFLYLYTGMSVEAGHRLANCVRFNILTLLFKFTRYKNPPPQQRPAIMSKQHLAKMDQRTIDNYHAAMWLQKTFEPDPNNQIPGQVMHQEYEKYCKQNQIAALFMPELMLLVQKVFTPQSVISQQNQFTVRGLRPKHDVAFGEDQQDELRGIPLTAVLVMRNIARHPDNKTLFYPYEQELAVLWTDPKYCKLVGALLFELK